MARTARQRAASRRNLAKARARKRRRVVKAAGAGALAVSALVGGSYIAGSSKAQRKIKYRVAGIRHPGSTRDSHGRIIKFRNGTSGLSHTRNKIAYKNGSISRRAYKQNKAADRHLRRMNYGVAGRKIKSKRVGPIR